MSILVCAWPIFPCAVCSYLVSLMTQIEWGMPKSSSTWANKNFFFRKIIKFVDRNHKYVFSTHKNTQPLAEAEREKERVCAVMEASLTLSFFHHHHGKSCKHILCVSLCHIWVEGYGMRWRKRRAKKWKWILKRGREREREREVKTDYLPHPLFLG